MKKKSHPPVHLGSHSLPISGLRTALCHWLAGIFIVNGSAGHFSGLTFVSILSAYGGILENQKAR
jgi:hypothetical protein